MPTMFLLMIKIFTGDPKKALINLNTSYTNILSLTSDPLIKFYIIKLDEDFKIIDIDNQTAKDLAPALRLLREFEYEVLELEAS